MWTPGLRGEDRTGARVEDGHHGAVELKVAALAPRHLGNVADHAFAFRHQSSPTRISANWFAVFGFARSVHGSNVAAIDFSSAASSAVAIPSLSSITTARIRSSPTRATNA